MRGKTKMYSKETFQIANKLWHDEHSLQNLIICLQRVQGLRKSGISYSNQDFDIKQGLAALLHALGKEA
jgi:hypothetical protein